MFRYLYVYLCIFHELIFALVFDQKDIFKNPLRELVLWGNRSRRVYLWTYLRTLCFSPNLNICLIPVWNVVVDSKEEHEAEEESETAEEVPKVVIVKEVEAGNALFVRHLRGGSTHVGVLHFAGVEEDGCAGTEDREGQESPTRSSWLLFCPQLHEEIEGEVEESVGDEDDKEDLGQLDRHEDHYRYQKIDDQKSDDELKPEEETTESDR